MIERRRYHRQPSAIPCRWRDQSGDFKAEIIDFSFGGACLGKSSDLPSKGTDIQLILFPGTQDVYLRGQVVYSEDEEPRPLRSGVEFVESHEGGLEKILPLLNCYLDDRD